jgi:glycosyltransferase involved in cell wall biosynthesis
MVDISNQTLDNLQYAIPKKYSILIPTWNNLPYLKLCIHSIKKNSFFNHQIIVHINEGTDGTLDWIKEQNDINYSHSEKNIGVCYALNSCRSLVQTEYIVYMNDDMYTCPGWDKALDDEVNKIGHNNFFLSATAIEPKAQSNCSIEKSFGTDLNNFDEESLLKEFASFNKEDWQGATWPPNIVHKNTWDIVGGYSIEFSPGLNSDPDFSMKLWKCGVRYFKGISKSRVYHFGSVSLKRVKRNNGYYMFVSKWRVTQNTFSKHYLRRGEIFDGELQQPELSFFIKMKNKFKKLKSVFFRY